MSIRSKRTSSFSHSVRLRKLRRERQLRLKTQRDLHVETLEERRLMAGLQLAGIATNQGALLRDGLVFNVPPKELVFRFNDGADLDPATLASGIEIIRSGGDGRFETASIRTDLNTNGAVLMEFAAVEAGSAGDGITLVVSKNARGLNGGVGIEVSGSQVKIDLNTTTGALTTAADLRTALNTHPEASQLVRATILRGNAFTNIATPEINYSPLRLSNANHARAASNFNQGSTVEVEFIAVQSGFQGNGIRLNFTQRDFGGAGGPRITVSDRTINVELNNRSGTETTAAALVNAINGDPAASQLVRARQTAGRATSKITSTLTIPSITLLGANDIIVTPGFIGLGEAPNIGVARFAETLPDDSYRVNILGRPGAGRQPVAERDGEVFRDGAGNDDVTFELDLGAQVLSIVPQPITRNANGQLVQARNQIHVYFNDDDLDRVSAENRNFYELIATSDTVRNTDDLSFRPIQVQYDAAADRAVLTFAANLEELVGVPGAATFRLRIGTDEALPLAPADFTPTGDVGSSFSTALNLTNDFETGAVLLVRGSGRSVADGQTITVTSRNGSSVILEFDNFLTGPAGVGAGNNREPIFFSENSTAEEIAQAIADAVISANNRLNLGLGAIASGVRVLLQNDSRVTLGVGLTAVTKTTQGVIISSTIDNVGQPYPLPFPGANNEPGHRQIPVENHLNAGADGLSGITRAFYNFQDDYGFDPDGNLLRNAITEVQKNRVREIFQLYGQYLGIQFIESSSQGMTIAVGDIRALDPTLQTGRGGVLGVAAGGLAGRLVMDLQDFDSQNDEFGEEFFRVIMHEIGHLLGLGHDTELPPLTIMTGFSQPVSATAEPVFPGDHDIVHGQFLYRPESKDIDLYRFEVTQTGLFTAETIAERLANSSLLDTSVTLYRETVNGRTVVARNDDYFSNDSYLELLLEPGVYYLGVSASGNSDYDPSIADSGIGGRSDGAYQLRLIFRGEATNGIIDADNKTNPTASSISAATLLDGDADGTPGGVFNFWFRAQTAADTIYVDKTAAASGANGSLARPFNNIAAALSAAQPGDIVRIVGNGGADGDITTLNDNLAYEVGFSALGGRTLADGPTLEVPKGVTVMVDSGVVIKSRRARIGVGSSSPSVDRSAGALQVLGVPRVIAGDGSVRRDVFGQAIPGNVVFTSLHDSIGITTNPDRNPPNAAPGDWGGLAFRADLDHRNATRFSYEKQGIFLNSVIYADIRFGGGNVNVNGVPTVVDPIYIADSRPTVAYSSMTRSAHAAVSANPNSFEESNFHSPEYQVAGAFTADYARLGPDIHGNRVVDNTLNGLFVRVRTAPGATPEQLTVAGRFDDTDIVHVLQENLSIAGTPGGPVLETVAPPVTLVTAEPGPVGGALAPGTYNYRITFVDANGNEGPASDMTVDVTIPGNPDVNDLENIGSIQLGNLPTLQRFPSFVSRRIYRSTPGGSGPYTLVARLNGSDTRYLDNGTTIGGELQAGGQVIRGRLDARLMMDPGLIVKSEASVIDVGMGANLIAEGNDGDRVVMTSLADRRYGAGGTFNTNNLTSANAASPGDWGGIFAGHASRLNLDFALLAYAGGVVRLEGGFRGFNALEIHQAASRVSNTIFELNDDGFAPVDNDPDSIESRFGRGFNRPSVIFIRGAQPILVDNIIRDNEAPAISINVNSLNSELVNDLGRATGRADIYTEVFGNRGPLIDGNRIGNNAINGMEVRHATLTTEGVWDDTDIVHVVRGSIDIADFHTYGGLSLVSRPTASLVVKLDGIDAGFTAAGKPLDIDDRIGGALRVLGQPRYPVVLTSITDDTAGAGFVPDGSPQTDTNNDGSGPVGGGGGGLPTGPEVDRGTLIDNDVDVNRVGFFSYQPDAGGGDAIGGGGGGGVTVRGRSGQLFVNDDYIFDFLNFVDVGSNGDGIDLASTTITQSPTLVAPDLVVSEGTLDGENGTINWRVETFLVNGLAKVFNRISFSSNNAFGNLQFINYLDEDVFGVSDDLMWIQGTPGQTDFRVFTLDGPERVGFSQGGIYTAGPDLVNATYVGWAADEYSDLLSDIGGGGTTYTVAGNIDTTSLPPFTDPDLGTVYGLDDITTAFAWSLDPNARTAVVTTFLELIPEDPITVVGQPGDWRSIRLAEYSHDRNVELVHELEPTDIGTPGTNALPGNAEFIGDLAPHEKAGDDKLRLGVEVRGAINNPKDVDVYRFTAQTGTEVWIDIDRTTHSLDTVVELITADGTVLARSDNSRDEAVNPLLLYRDSSMPSNHINILQKSVFDGVDRYTTNPRDAGMRVILPGSAGVRGTYYVRVRSAGTEIDNLGGGLTKGVYQMQLRLRETDEVPGSAVRSADIRFATNGIEILGQPIHSPLLGEIGEDTSANDNANNAQQLGNYLNTDRAALGIAGRLISGTDIDFYRFDAIFTDVQQPSTAAQPQYVATTFDVDYADGLGRPNTLLSIFDINGNLVLVADNSNIAEDQPAPLAGANMDDLTRGTAGKLDPFLGTVELPVGSYFAAVSPVTQMPTQLAQFTSANPVNPLLRLEPVNSTLRLAEDHIGSSGGSTAQGPVVPVLLDDSSIVPWTLGDLALYVSQDPGTVDQTNVFTVNPFTGRRTTQVGRFNFDIGDFAFRPNGDLMAYTLDLEQPPVSDASTGFYIRIDPGTAAVTQIGDSGIETYQSDGAAPPNAVQSNHGMHFEAITFGHVGDNVERGFAVGNRPRGVFAPGIQFTRNALYEFLPNTGEAISFPAQDRDDDAELLSGAGTQIVERGVLITDADPNNARDTVLIAPEATAVDLNDLTTSIIVDGTRFAVRNGAVLTQFEFVSGPEVRMNLDPTAANPVFIRDGDTFFLDGTPFEFDTGEVLVVDALNGFGIQDGDRFTVTDKQPVPVTRIFEWDNGSGSPVAANVVRVSFNGGMNRAALVAAAVNAINNQTGLGSPAFTASAVSISNRISLLNSSGASESSSGMHVEGNTGRSNSRAMPNAPGTVLIPIEEVSDNAELGASLQLVFNGQAGPPAIPGVPNIDVGAEGDRANFVGPNSGNFNELVQRGVFIDLGNDRMPSSPTFTAVAFFADDTADEIAARVANAINSSPGLSASTNGEVITVGGGARFDRPGTDIPPFKIAGAGPGGDVTGIAFIGTQMFAVSDRGGLYRVLNPSSAGGATADYIESSTDLLGINFQALAAGPRNTENSRFDDILFGIDDNGRVYAFNRAGELQPVFANGQTFVDTGITDPNGLTFSILDTNLWHRTNSRAGDAGHGLNQPFDGSRQAQPGNSSYWFGWESQAANDVIQDPFHNPVNNSADYNFPGGAHGAMMSHEFSLEGYAPEDVPVLYFNYRLQTENASAVLGSPPQFMRDAFRVYVSDENGEWHLVATNNSGRRAGALNDEYDNFSGLGLQVQELFDIGENGAPNSWRQARVPLAAFAGQENLRLRFEFSTAGSLNVGGIDTTGIYLQTGPANELRDGQRLLIDNDVFEVDLGATLVAPSGADLTDGETFTIHSRVFEFEDAALSNGVGNGRTPIVFNRAMSASAVALEIERALATASYVTTADLRAESAGNEVLSTAVNSGLTGGADIFRASGVIGDNPNLIANPGLDVDMVRLNLNRGDTIQVRAYGNNSLDSYLRFFDAAGVELADSDNAVGTDARIGLTVQRSGVYYVGVSGSPNGNYNPSVANTSSVGDTGNYDLEIIVNGFTGVVPRRHDNRVQLDGALKVSQSSNASLVIDGEAGVDSNSLPLAVHADMTDIQVAQVLQAALANRYSGGVLGAFPRDEQRVQVIQHDVVAPGPFGFADNQTGDQFGSFFTSTNFDGSRDANNPGALRAQNNDFEGVYIDDIVIGFAERGEMATGSTANSAFIANPVAPANQIVSGNYQLEIRRSEEYGIAVPAPVPTLLLLQTFDTNDRISQQHTIEAPSADQVVDGQTFTLSDGVDSVVFEFEDVNVADGVAQGHIAIPFNPSAPDGRGGRSPESSTVIAQRIRDAINSVPVQSVLQLRAGFSDGEASGFVSTDARVDLFGNSVIGSLTGNVVNGNLSAATEANDTKANAVQGNVVPGSSSTWSARGEIGDNPTLVGNNASLDVDLIEFQFTAGTQLSIDIDAAQQGSPVDAIVRLFDTSGNELAISDDNPAPGEPFTLDSYLEYIIPLTGTYYIGISSFANDSYNVDQQASGQAGASTGFYDISITAESGGIGFTRHEGYGDQNLNRDQGQLIISSSRISGAAEMGIVVDGGLRDGPEGNPHQGPTRVTRELNSQRLVPGVVIENNVIFDNREGAIRFAGTGNGPDQQVASVPFGRIVNNTLYGRFSSDVGIEVANNASPTLLNNIVANFGRGITVDPSSASTVIGGTLFQGNGTNSNAGLGEFALTIGPNDPLFIDAKAGNFYLQRGSQAIDSAINSLNDRPALISVRAPLGIPVSPILAPQRDALGQLRSDDPTAEPPPGAGENVFVDRGAIDRADFGGPTASIIDPRDNDSRGLDLDPRESFVKLSVISVDGFSIQLLDGVEPVDPINGSGIDDRTVTRDQITLLRDGVRLVEGIDYRFRYDALNDIIRLTPIAGIFETNHTYVIEVANRDQFVISAPGGDAVDDGDFFSVSDQEGNTATFEYESGYTITVVPTLALIMPQAGGGLGGVTDRQSFTVRTGTITTTFEFDNNGSVAAGRVPIVFTPQTSAEQLALAVVDALTKANIGLSPVDLGQGRVHVGVQPTDLVNIGNAPSLQRTGSETGGVLDGDVFTLDDGTRVMTFELDRDGERGATIAINYLLSDTHEDIADRIAAAIRTNAPSLNPVHLGDGFIHLGGTLLTVLDTSTSSLGQSGQPGVQPDFGILIPSTGGKPVGITDGQTFQLGDGVQLPVTFEFDTNGQVVPGNTVVRIPVSNATLDQIANAMVQAISSVGIGLTPTNVGGGRVTLKDDTTSHVFDPLTSVLQQLGTPGVDASIAVPFVPDDSFTAENMAARIAQLINSTTSLENVTATVRDDQVILDGASSVMGIVQVFVAGIRDVAGNVLRANQDTGESRFTILMGSGLDFGDAPSNRNYPTLNSQNGARHTIVPGYTLGSLIDVDVDGQPNTSADGDDTDGVDDEDGVTFATLSRGYGSTITVSANGISAARPGFLDAWVDWNNDGDWNDAEERILTAATAVNGENVFEITVPVTAITGPTFARVRLSTTGNLTPFGDADDGEVEDYRVVINPSPWQNGAFPADVNGDGRVQPFDVLQVVSFLIKYGSQAVPVPPPFIAANGDQIFPTGRMIDVDGNTRVQPFDALLVIRALRERNGEGASSAEGEDAEGESRSISSSSMASMTIDWPAPVVVTSSTETSEQAPAANQAPRATSTVREVTFRLDADRPSSSGDVLIDLVEKGDALDDLLDAIVDETGSDQRLQAHDELFANLSDF